MTDALPEVRGNIVQPRAKHHPNDVMPLAAGRAGSEPRRRSRVSSLERADATPVAATPGRLAGSRHR